MRKLIDQRNYVFHNATLIVYDRVSEQPKNVEGGRKIEGERKQEG